MTDTTTTDRKAAQRAEPAWYPTIPPYTVANPTGRDIPDTPEGRATLPEPTRSATEASARRRAGLPVERPRA